jgi:hypothetical protein
MHGSDILRIGQLRFVPLPRAYQASTAERFYGGNGRLGTDLVDQFSPERREPRGMTACALRAAIASWHLRVSYAPYAPSAVTLPIFLSDGV